MEKVKKSKFLLVAILMGLMICCMSLLSACYTVWYLHNIAGGGYSVDKIIYTDDVDKYLAGRTVVEKLQCGSTGLLSGPANGIWILETDIVNKYDIVLTTQSIDYIDEDSGETEKGGYYPIGYAADMGYYVMNDTWSYTLLTNSHIFSGLTGHYTPGGDYDCTNTNCAGFYDSWDGCMGCNRWNEASWIVDTQKTDTEVIEHFNLCPACNSVVETVNDDGTYTYTTQTNCTCKGWFYHDGTWQREYKSWLQINEQGIVSSFRFDELVLDGYDFGVLYDFITTYDYDKVYTNWEQFYNPGDFSNMFSDLPVEKITIKNVKGLGDRAEDLSGMFENCLNLKTVEFGNLFENCKPKDISRMFYRCPNLQNVDLTTLDTSEVENMSEMFAIGTSKILAEERDGIVEEYINNEIVPNDDSLNDGTIYTIDSYAEKVGISKEMVYIQVALESKLNYPITYTELTKGMYNLTFVEFIQAVMEDPTQFGMAAGEYAVPDVVNYIENTSAAYGINAVYDADIHANTYRDEYVNYVINNLAVPLISGLQDTAEVYTLDSFAEFVGLSREETLFAIIDNTGLDIPVTYGELCLYLVGMPLDDFVDQVNADPSIAGLEPKEDGTPYTAEELYVLLDDTVQQSGYIALTDQELLDYYTSKKTTPRGRLVLGGAGSKFVIKEGTNVSNIFGEYCYFATVVAPNEIADNIEIPLIVTFTHNDVDVVTKITAADASKTFVYKEIFADEPEDPIIPDEPEDPVVPEDPENPTEPTDPVVPDTTPTTPEEPEEEKKDEEDNDNIAVIVIAATGGTAVVGGAGVTTVKLIRRKKKPMTIKDQKL